MVAKKKEERLSTSQKVLSKIKKADEKKKEIQESKPKSAVILLNHIPHGFYEKELKSFFAQFGTVRRTLVARSQKTGKSKGYAYVEFEFADVAKIAAETMDNYLMFEKLIKCQVLPDANTKKIFKYRFTNRNNCPTIKRRNRIKELQEIPKTVEEQQALYKQRVSKLRKQNAKLAQLGINYEFTVPSSTPEPQQKVVKQEPESPKQQVGKKESVTPKQQKKIVKKESPKQEKQQKAVEKEQAKEKGSPKEKPKFSPKLLRSKNRPSDASALLSTQTEVPDKTVTTKRKSVKQNEAKPKFSPKLLRSSKRRLSDVPTPTQTPNKAAATKGRGRKSMK